LGKTAQLRIMTGVNAPQWLYDVGVRGFEFSDARKSETSFTMPVPWDPILLEKWRAFCKALGARYANNKAVVLVHIAGPTRFSAEMHLPREVLRQPGYSADAMVAAWKSAAQSVGAAFPHTAIALDVAKVVHPRDGITQRVMAECGSLLGRRATFQHNALSAKTRPGFLPQRLVTAQQAAGRRVGFQMLSDSAQPRFAGSLATALRLAVEAGAHYVEVYPGEAVRQLDVLAQFAPRFVKAAAK
jgi:hypothetical protein